MPENEWLLFLSQLPASPSSLRVMVWRKMRTAGAAGLQNGVWVLPNAAEQKRFLEELLMTIKRQGGSGQVFVVRALNQAFQDDILSRFRTDRDHEYDEFNEQCQAFLAEIEKETGRQKFSFAELEENEQSFQRLKEWIAKIRKRDFFHTEKTKTALAALEDCWKALQAFANRVYTQEGMKTSTDDHLLSEDESMTQRGKSDDAEST